MRLSHEKGDAMRPTHSRLTLVLVLFLAAATLGWAASADESGSIENPFHWTGKLTAGQTLGIKDVSGTIDVQGAPGDQVEVTAEKHGSGADDVRIQVVQDSQGVTICAIFPNGRGGEASSCEPGSEWHVHSEGNNHARVDFTVRLPRDVRLLARNVNGAVNATGLGAVADATSVNGSLKVDTAEWAKLTTVNGSVTASFGKADWPDQLRIASVNGSIDLTLPADLNTSFEYQSVNGHFDSDFPLNVQGHISPRHMSGTIGRGGRDLKLDTVNGNVALHKGTM